MLRAAVQGRHPHRRAQSVDRVHRAHRVRPGDRRRRVLRPADPPRRTADVARRCLVGLAQCLALVPGVSRSGATISAGLFLGLDRELAARFGFLLAIPAVFASGLFSLPDAFEPVSEGHERHRAAAAGVGDHHVRGGLRRDLVAVRSSWSATACTGSSATGSCSAWSCSPCWRRGWWRRRDRRRRCRALAMRRSGAYDRRRRCRAA